MSASLGTRVGLLSAAFSCMLVAHAAAQQSQDTSQRASGQSTQDAVSSPATGQTGGAAASQTDRSSAESAIPGTQSGQRYTANFRGEAAGAGAANQQVDQFIVGCLIAKNQSEIELSQLAAQQAQNPEVKKFAQQMVQDHQQMVKQLQQIAGTQGAADSRGRTSSPALGTSGASDRTRATSDASGTTRTDTSATDASATTGTSSLSGASDTSSAGEGSSSLTGSAATSGRETASSAAGGAGSGAVQQLLQIERQIVDRATQATRDELQQKQGAEFDKAFVGCAIGAHVHMNAALEVIGQQTQGQLAQVAQQAQPKVQQHLEHAKSLMQQLDQASPQSSSTNRAARETSDRQR